MTLFLKRKIYDEIDKWFREPYTKALQIEGARQCGKSFIIERFLEDNCNSQLILDFTKEPSYKGFFEGSLDPTSIIQKIALGLPGFRPVPGETVLFFDEIQMCPEAITSLKMFVDDGRYRVIASGSLLGLNLNKVRSQPVGRVKYLRMHSMDFEEFLWGIGLEKEQTDTIRSIIREGRPFGRNILNTVSEYFAIYSIVGGMPEAVGKYLETQDFLKVREIQKTILDGYRRDILEYAERSDRDKILASFESIPAQLSKESSKFVYRLVDGEFVPRYSTYETSINWMVSSSIVNVCRNVSSLALPLESFAVDNQFKLYLHDTGLLTSMYDPDLVKSILSRDTRVNRGPIGENIIAECLVKCGKHLHYFSARTLEIDFVVAMGMSVAAVEVKSGNNKQAKSLRSLKEKYNVGRRMVFESSDIYTDKNGIEHYPMFAAAFFDELYKEPSIDISIDLNGRDELKALLNDKHSAI